MERLFASPNVVSIVQNPVMCGFCWCELTYKGENYGGMEGVSTARAQRMPPRTLYRYYDSYATYACKPCWKKHWAAL